MNGELSGSADVVFEGVHSTLAIERPGAGIVVLRLTGWDVGELGNAPMRELAKDVAVQQGVEFFIDARAVKAATTDVSSDWAQWLAKHRSRFGHISMLTGSPFIQLTANFVRQFAELGDIMRLYTDPVAFDAALALSVNNSPSIGIRAT